MKRSNSVSSLKRPFDHLDQNNQAEQATRHNKPFYVGGDSTKSEPLAKRLELDCTLGSSNSSKMATSYTAAMSQINAQSQQGNAAMQASKMKIKIVSKEGDMAADKAISITIELNGDMFTGTLFSIAESSGKLEASTVGLKTDVVC